MRAVQIALLIIMINLAASFVVEANVFGSRMYYESEVLKNVQSSSQQDVSNIPIINQVEQVSSIFTIVKDVIFGSLTFNWLDGLVPRFIAENGLYTNIIAGLNVVLWIFIALASIDLINSLKGGGRVIG